MEKRTDMKAKSDNDDGDREHPRRAEEKAKDTNRDSESNIRQTHRDEKNRREARSDAASRQ